MVSSQNKLPFTYSFLTSVVGLVVVILAWGAVFLWVYPFISDDALISLRYSRRLSQGLGLTWSAGNTVEGFTNMLWVLINGFLMLFTKNGLLTARLAGGLLALGTLWLVWQQVSNKAFVYVAWAGLLPLPVWVSGGLEQALLFFLVVGSAVHSYQIIKTAQTHPPTGWALLKAGFWYPFLFATRPDAALFIVVPGLWLGWFYLKKQPVAKWYYLLWFAAPMVAGVLGLTAFRLWYFDAWVPNTVHVKVTGSNYHIGLGISYVLVGLTVRLPVLLFLAFMVLKNKKYIALWPLISGLLWLGWVAYSGGDIFPAYRHFVPFDALIGLSVGWSVWLGKPKQLHWLWVLLLASGVMVALQTRQTDFKRALTERWEYCGLRLGTQLGAAFPGKTVALNTAGCIPYAANMGQMPVIDMLGLNNKIIAQSGGGKAGTETPAHGHANGAYVMAQQPDFVIFGVLGDSLPAFNSGVALFNHPDFKSTYKPFGFKVKPQKGSPCMPNGFTSVIYVNLNRNIELLRDNKRLTPAF